MTDSADGSDDSGPCLEHETKRRAAAVLEVLGGLRTPREAAEMLGLSLPRYYHLEARSLDAMISACAVGRPGRSPEGQTFHDLQREIERLRAELTRSQALLRAIQRAAGMPAEESPTKEGVKKRRPQARALRAARALNSDGLANPPMP
jgi:hypothetical protein